MKRWKRPGNKVELIVGDLDDFESPGIRLHGYVRDDKSAERCLLLVAADMGLDPVGWLWLPRGE